MLTPRRKISINSDVAKYIAYAVIFIAIVLLFDFFKPKQQIGWEYGRFIDRRNGNIVTIDNGTIEYMGDKTTYTLWIGKGERFLTTKRILDNLYSIETATGNRVPAEFILENKKNASPVCSLESNNNSVCFYRIK
jgi:hypothetical protein